MKKGIFIVCLLMSLIPHAIAKESHVEIGSMACTVRDEFTRTYEKKNSKLNTNGWLGTPKRGDMFRLVFRKTPSALVSFDIDPGFFATLGHLVDTKIIESDRKSWLTHSDAITGSFLRIYRMTESWPHAGLKLISKNSRNSLDIRHNYGSEWTGFILNDVIGDPGINSIQIISVNCVQSVSNWDKLFEQLTGL